MSTIAQARRRHARESGPVTLIVRIVFLLIYGVPVAWILVTLSLIHI